MAIQIPPEPPIQRTPSHEAASTIVAAGDRIHAFQSRSTYLFSVGVDILNASRLLETMGFELRLLALNGMVQAAHLGSTLGSQGDGLLALARILSDSPRTMSPLIQGLGAHCRSIALHTATCSSLARRYLQHFRALAIALTQECPEDEQQRFLKTLRNADLLRESELRETLSRLPGWGLPARMTGNVLLIADRCGRSLQGIASEFREVRQDLVQVRHALSGIERCTDTVKYLGVNVSIEAAHMAQAGEKFRQLAVDIDDTLETFSQRLATIRKSTGRGEALLTELGGRKHHA